MSNPANEPELSPDEEIQAAQMLNDAGELPIEFQDDDGINRTITCPETVDFVSDLLAKRRRKSEIRDALAEIFQEKISNPLLNALIARGYKVLYDRYRQRHSIKMAEHEATLEEIIRDPKSTNAIRLQALSQLSALHGFDAAMKVVATMETPQDKAEGIIGWLRNANLKQARRPNGQP